jgi:hypothetical protein
MWGTAAQASNALCTDDPRIPLIELNLCAADDLGNRKTGHLQNWSFD